MKTEIKETQRLDFILEHQSYIAGFLSQTLTLNRSLIDSMIEETERDKVLMPLRFRCFDIAPVREMQRRHWIQLETDSTQEIAAALRKFFELPDDFDLMGEIPFNLQGRTVASIPAAKQP